MPTTGSGQATLYIVGPGDALRHQVQLGENITFGPDDLHNAGHYVAFLVAGSSTQNAQFEVVASRQPATLSFLAKPSRLPVNLSNGLSGVVYVFDVLRNLVVQPQQVSFELSDSIGRAQSRTATSREGVAWVKMNSAAKAGPAQFQAVAGNIREKRVIQQVPGDPCSIRMTARGSGQEKRVTLETEPVRDCSGNPVPDGTIVTFTETYRGGQSTVDVPLKRGVAHTEMPARNGAVISVAAGVVMGNEIRWSGGL
ncbi:MAG: hypothetical protein WAQ52_03845 [Terriglobales bacterium]